MHNAGVAAKLSTPVHSKALINSHISKTNVLVRIVMWMP